MQAFPTTSSRFLLPGPDGSLEVAVEIPKVEQNVVFVMCHPHPLHQGTMNNKVVTTVIRAMSNIGVYGVSASYVNVC